MILIYFNTDILTIPLLLYYQTFKFQEKTWHHHITYLCMNEKSVVVLNYPLYHRDKTQKCLFIAFSHSVFSPVHFSSVVFWLRETAVIPNHQIHIYCYIYYYYYYTTQCKNFFYFSPQMANAVIKSLRRGENGEFLYFIMTKE